MTLVILTPSPGLGNVEFESRPRDCQRGAGYNREETDMTTTTTADMIREQFQYWDEVPPLYPVRSTDELQRNYENQSGPTHWFDPDTLRFFGSRNRHLVRPGVMVETQTKAPEGVGRYTVTAWVIDITAPRDHRTMGRITPQKVGTFHDLTEARRFAVAVSDAWVEAMRNVEVTA